MDSVRNPSLPHVDVSCGIQASNVFQTLRPCHFSFLGNSERINRSYLVFPLVIEYQDPMLNLLHVGGGLHVSQILLIHNEFQSISKLPRLTRMTNGLSGYIWVAKLEHHDHQIYYSTVSGHGKEKAFELILHSLTVRRISVVFKMGWELHVLLHGNLHRHFLIVA